MFRLYAPNVTLQLGRQVSQSDEELITCDDCNRDFPGDDCFVKHLLPKVTQFGRGKMSVCEVRKKSKTCMRAVTKDGRNHRCNEFYCKTCENFEPYSH